MLWPIAPLCRLALGGGDDCRVQEGGEGLVLPLHPSAAATSISERENYSREVTGSFEELISHPSPPARKHLESFSTTVPSSTTGWFLAGDHSEHPALPVAVLVSLWFPAGDQKQGRSDPMSHTDPQLPFVLVFFLLFICLFPDSKLPAGVI